MLVRVRRLLSSPRRRRRLFRISGVVVAVGCAIAIGFLYPNTGRKEAGFSPGKPQVTHEEAPATPLPKGDIADSEQALDHFVRTAVLRRHVDDSYDLVTRNLRAGMTRKRVAHGRHPGDSVRRQRLRLRQVEAGVLAPERRALQRAHLGEAEGGHQLDLLLDRAARGGRRQEPPLARGLLRAGRRRALDAGEAVAEPAQRPRTAERDRSAARHRVGAPAGQHLQPDRPHPDRARDPRLAAKPPRRPRVRQQAPPAAATELV